MSWNILYFIPNSFIAGPYVEIGVEIVNVNFTGQIQGHHFFLSWALKVPDFN